MGTRARGRLIGRQRRFRVAGVRGRAQSRGQSLFCLRTLGAVSSPAKPDGELRRGIDCLHHRLRTAMPPNAAPIPTTSQPLPRPGRYIRNTSTRQHGGPRQHASRRHRIDARPCSLRGGPAACTAASGGRTHCPPLAPRGLPRPFRNPSMRLLSPMLQKPHATPTALPGPSIDAWLALLALPACRPAVTGDG